MNFASSENKVALITGSAIRVGKEIAQNYIRITIIFAFIIITLQIKL